MPKWSSKKPSRPNANQIAARILREATGEEPKTTAVEPPDPEENPAAVEHGRLGGFKGRHARAKN